MSISATSSSNALSTIQSLLQSVANTAGNVAGIGPVGDILASVTDGAAGSKAGGGAAHAFGPAPHPFPDGTMAALIALKSQDTGGAHNLFDKLDGDGDGKVSQSEFESALSQSSIDKSSADVLFAKIDRNGDGSVDMGELMSALRRGHGHHGHKDADTSCGAADPSGADALLNATGADGAKTQTTTNEDGSSTTTITYTDGSTVTMTTPPPPPASGQSGDSGTGTQTGSNANSANLIEQLIKMQAQLVAQQGATVSATA